MAQPNANRFHPKRWTVVTWLAILFWAWQALPRNYPPSVFYTRDPATGEHTVLTHRKSLSDIPYQIGWPLRYITPSDNFSAVAVAIGTPPAPPLPPAPSSVSLFAMVYDRRLFLADCSCIRGQVLNLSANQLGQVPPQSESSSSFTRSLRQPG